jgi:hypothetical protein
MWYNVQGTAVIYHDCKCPHCTRDDEHIESVNAVLKAQDKGCAALKAISSVQTEDYESVVWDDGCPMVHPLPEDQQLNRLGVATLPGL